MADDQNPFSQYSGDEQKYIATQLRTAASSGKLNPAQTQSVNSALKNLPMSTGASNSQIQSLATGGAGTWRPDAPLTPFEATPQADLDAARRGVSVSHEPPNPRPDTVGYVPGGFVRSPVDSKYSVRQRTMINQTQEVAAVNAKSTAAAGQFGGDLGAAISPNVPGMGDSRPIGRAAGSFLGSTLADPTTYAQTLLPGSKFVSAAFALQGAAGTYEAGKQLADVWDRQDVPRDRKLELGTNIVLNGLMTGLAAHHTVSSLLDHPDLAHIPAEDRTEIQHNIEAAWQQTPDGKILPRNTPRTPFDQLTQSGLGNSEKKIASSVPKSSADYSTSSLTGSKGTQAVNPEINSRLFPEGTTLHPYATRTPDGRIPMSIQDAQPFMGSPDLAKAINPLENTRGRENNPPPVSGPEVPPKGSSPQPKIDTSRQPGESMDSWVDRVARAAEDSRKQNALNIDPKTGKPWDFGIQAHYDRLRSEDIGDEDFHSSEPDQTPPVSSKPFETRLTDSDKQFLSSINDAFKDKDTSGSSVADEKSVEAPKPSAPKTPVGASEPVDTRNMSPEERHDWYNKNAPVALNGETAESARKYASVVFGEENAKKLEIVQYIDKNGATRFGSKFPEKAQVIERPSPAASDEVREVPDAALSKVQDAETEFNTRTGGKHTEILKSLWDATNKTLPLDTPREAKLDLYHKGLKSLLSAVASAKGPDDFKKAFDIVTKKAEGGFFSLNGRNRASDKDIELLSRLHVDTVLTRWENLPDGALAGRKVVSKLQDPSLRNSVYGAKDPALEMRYEDLLRRAGGARATDPVTAIAAALDGHIITGGDVTRGALREALATVAHTSEQRAAQFKSYRDAWNKRSIEDILSFYDTVEHGNINMIDDPLDKAFAQSLRQQYDARQGQLVSMGLLDHFNDNYVGRLWKYGIKDAAAAIMTGRRNIAGTPSGLRARTYNTFSEGIAAGLEPVSWNPVDMFLLKMGEMDKYLAAKSAFDELQTKGLVKSFDPKDIPWNWQPLDHRMFNTGGAKLYAPAESVKLFNNFLSTGLRGNIVYDALANYNNVVNQFNLGFSAFHATETAVNATISEVAMGLQKLTRGDIRGVGNILASGARSLRAYFTGRQIFQEYMEPGRFGQMKQLVDALDMAGGRVRISPEYKNAAGQGLRNAWMELSAAQGMENVPKAGKVLYRSVGAGLEKMSVPLMEKFVPYIKLGTFAMMAQDAHARMMDAGGTIPRDAIRDEFSRIWDSVDNRFGQIVYDNLFWNRAGKDLAHLMIRSVGWNYGTVREIGGGVFNLQETKAALTGKGLSYRQSYTLGLLGFTAAMGYVMNAFYQQTPTPKIDGLADYLYPPNGKTNPDGSKQRTYLKTYAHDIYGWGHAPGDTVVNKLAPEWHQIGELYRNADYYGTQIHPIHGSTGDALRDPSTYTGVGSYLGKSMEPFSVRNFVERHNAGESIASSLTSGAAILPAPKWVGQTAAQSLSFELFKAHLPQGPTSQTRQEMAQNYHEYASGYAAGRYTNQDLTAAWRAGKLTDKMYDGIFDGDGKLSPLERYAKTMDPPDMLRVWNLANPQEKRTLSDQFFSKWDGIDKYPVSAEQKDVLSQKFKAAWQTYKSSQKSN